MSNSCRYCGSELEQQVVSNETYLVCHKCRKRFRTSAGELATEPPSSGDAAPIARRKKKRSKAAQSGSMTPWIIGAVVAGVLLTGVIVLLGRPKENRNLGPEAPGEQITAVSLEDEAAPVQDEEQAQSPEADEAEPEEPDDAPFDLSVVQVPDLPELPTYYQQDGGIQQYFVKLENEEVPGGETQIHIYRPTGKIEPASRPLVLIPAAGRNPLMGMFVTVDHQMEHRAYARQGFVVVAFSVDGVVTHGHGDDACFEGIKKLRDAKAGLVNAKIAMEFALQRLVDVDPERIACAGHGSGGTIALLLAAHEPRIQACAAYAPFTDLIAHFGPAAIGALNAKIPGAWAFAKRSSPVTHSERIECPVFLLHFEGDRVSQPAQSQQLHSILENKGVEVELTMLPDGDHTMSVISEGIPKGAKWLAEKLGMEDS